MIEKAAFIIGNGKSRQNLNLAQLRKHGTIYGCNALYREFEPDVLVAIDPEMIEEIRNSNFPKNKFVIPPPQEHFEPVECNKFESRSNAGMNAMLLAIKDGHKDLYCLGFDFVWTDDKKSISNIYENTSNYSGDRAAKWEDNVGRVRYLVWTAAKYKDVRFWMVYPESYFDKLGFHSIPVSNVNGLTFGRFKEILDN